MPRKHFVTTDSEYLFYEKILPHLKVIFDVGSSDETEFLDFEGEVHYFDPFPSYIQNLAKQEIKNSVYFLNAFGLGDENGGSYYYPLFASFYDRIKSCGKSDEQNKVFLEIKKAKDYMIERGVEHVDFLKIDTEGYEFKILKGFEDFLTKVSVIQFEYGGTFIDNETKLKDVIEYLSSLGFGRFSLLTPTGPVEMTDFSDTYEYSNIVCVNKNSTFDPFSQSD